MGSRREHSGVLSKSGSRICRCHSSDGVDHLGSEVLRIWSEAMLFRSKESRATERRNEFVEFLRSAEGRRAIFELAPDILVSSKLNPILNDVRTQLELITATEIERFKLLLANSLGTAEIRFTDKIN